MGILRLNCVVSRRLAWIVALIVGAAAFVPGTARADLVNTSIYTSYSDNFPTGVQFSGTPTSNISTPDFQQFGTAAGNFMWYPQGLIAFAADTVGYINVPTANSFTFIDAGVQDSYVFVDGVQTVFLGSDLVAQNQATIPLSAAFAGSKFNTISLSPRTSFLRTSTAAGNWQSRQAMGSRLSRSPNPPARASLLLQS